MVGIKIQARSLDVLDTRVAVAFGLDRSHTKERGMKVSLYHKEEKYKGQVGSHAAQACENDSSSWGLED